MRSEEFEIGDLAMVEPFLHIVCGEHRDPGFFKIILFF